MLVERGWADAKCTPGSECENHLTTDCKRVRVTRNGVRFNHLGESFAYNGEGTARLVGQTVKCLWDNQSPEVAYLETDAGELFVVKRQQATPSHRAASVRNGGAK